MLFQIICTASSKQAGPVKNPPFVSTQLCWCSCCRKDPSCTENLSLLVHKKKLHGSSHMEQHLEEVVLQISHFNCFTHLPYFSLEMEVKWTHSSSKELKKLA